jgi:hypothetical protein
MWGQRVAEVSDVFTLVYGLAPIFPTPGGSGACSGILHAVVAVWLLDIDGVLNVLAGRGTAPKDRWQDLVQTEVSDGETVWPITYSPTLMERIRDLHMCGRVEVRWLTTWADAVHDLARHIGLPAATVVTGDSEDAAGGQGWWKFRCAVEVARVTDRVVWTDDELPLHRRAWEWAQAQPNVLAPHVKPTVGITPGQMQAIQDWL